MNLKLTAVEMAAGEGSVELKFVGGGVSAGESTGFVAWSKSFFIPCFPAMCIYFPSQRTTNFARIK